MPMTLEEHNHDLEDSDSDSDSNSMLSQPADITEVVLKVIKPPPPTDLLCKDKR